MISGSQRHAAGISRDRPMAAAFDGRRLRCVPDANQLRAAHCEPIGASGGNAGFPFPLTREYMPARRFGLQDREKNVRDACKNGSGDQESKLPPAETARQIMPWS